MSERGKVESGIIGNLRGINSGKGQSFFFQILFRVACDIEWGIEEG